MLGAAWKRRIRRIGLFALDATTRTWGAFWGTIVVWVIYWLWNADAPAVDRFDPYPFIFLTLLITQASYLQNIVLMTDQRIAAVRLEDLRRQQEAHQEEIRRKQDATDRYMLHLIETIHAMCAVLLDERKESL